MKTKLPSIVTILILSLATSLMWIVVAIYQVYKTPIQLKVSDSAIQEINPSLDTQTINVIISKDQLKTSDFVVSQPIPISTVLPKSTSTPKPEPTILNEITEQ